MESTDAMGAAVTDPKRCPECRRRRGEKPGRIETGIIVESEPQYERCCNPPFHRPSNEGEDPACTCEPTGECRVAMSGPTCRNPDCPPCQTPELRTDPDCPVHGSSNEGLDEPRRWIIIGAAGPPQVLDGPKLESGVEVEVVEAGWPSNEGKGCRKDKRGLYECAFNNATYAEPCDGCPFPDPAERKGENPDPVPADPAEGERVTLWRCPACHKLFLEPEDGECPGNSTHPTMLPESYVPAPSQQPGEETRALREAATRPHIRIEWDGDELVVSDEDGEFARSTDYKVWGYVADLLTGPGTLKATKTLHGRTREWLATPAQPERSDDGE